MEIYDCFDNCTEKECYQCGYDVFPIKDCIKSKKIKQLKDGESCGHTGCLNHISHPCEYCGRIAGMNNLVKVDLDGLNCQKSRERQSRWDIRFLELCKFFATKWSKDPSTQCGSVIVRDVNKFVSLGYNGYPAGVKDDDSLHHRETKYAKVVHSEVNAILFSKCDLSDCTLYVWPIPPCSNCMSIIIQSGIKRVVSINPTDDIKSRWNNSNEIAFEMAKQSGVEIKLYDQDSII